MRIVRHPRVLHGRPLVAVLGNFDGLHRGHRRLILEAQKYARKIRAEVAVISLEPHPQQVVAPERGLRLLTTVAEKSEQLKKMGVPYLVILKFTPHLQALSYRAFVKKYLVALLRVKAVVVGYDHAFGKDRKGGPRDLVKLGKRFGFRVKIVPEARVRFIPVKSSVIRREIARGNFDWALKLLGYPYPISGVVCQGMGRGGEMGFPTINLRTPKEKILPAHGVYAGWAELPALKNKKKRFFPAAIYVGSRPTFPERRVAVEAHLFKSKVKSQKSKMWKNIHGKKVVLRLVRRVRGDRQFSDIRELQKAIAKDVRNCRYILGRVLVKSTNPGV